VLEFVFPQTGYATLKVYSLLGLEVATGPEGNAETEQINAARFDGSNMPAGQAGLPSDMYFYQLRSEP
jgi:hypothetical protein